MALSIQPVRVESPYQCIPAYLSSLPGKAIQVFAKVKETLLPRVKNDAPPKSTFNLRVFLKQSSALIEGSFYGAFLGLSAYSAANSVSKLYRTWTAEHPAQERFKKIGCAAKTAFVDMVSVASWTAYLAHWADRAKVISLGRYLPIVKNLCFATSVVTNGVEVAAGIYNIWTEKEAIVQEKSPEKREKHKQWLCHALMKLIGNVSMVAWASLGIAILAGLAVSPILLSALFNVGFVVGGGAFLYKMQLDKSPKVAAAQVPLRQAV
jgi:hypothetical protein